MLTGIRISCGSVGEPAEAVDGLRAAAGTIILDSLEFKRLLKDVGATLVTDTAGAGPASGASR